MNKPIVTVACTTYNHEKYIEQTIRGFLIQKTTFPIEIIIHDDVWIGANAVILPNCEIGKGVIVGAGAVVTSNIDSYSIVGGVPAKLIKKREII